jgi:hypothetical protein
MPSSFYAHFQQYSSPEYPRLSDRATPPASLAFTETVIAVDDGRRGLSQCRVYDELASG